MLKFEPQESIANILEEDHHLITQLVNYDPVCRTGLATLGLLINV